MASGWTCGNCKAENARGNRVCGLCGRTRDGPARVAPAKVPSTADPEVQGRAGIALRRALGPVRRYLGGVISEIGFRLVLLVVFIAVLAGIRWATTFSRAASGEIDHAGDVAFTDLRAGDCFDLKGNGTELTIGDVVGRPCSEEHGKELFFIGTMPDDARSLSEDVIRAWSDSACSPAFESYVGRPLGASTLWVSVVSPLRASWDAGDHTAACVLQDRGDQPLKGSMKGSKR